MLFCIIADDEFDQVCETPEAAAKEKRDLTKMGHVVKIKEVPDWQAANKLEEKMRGY
jgi:hypothetical protein